MATGFLDLIRIATAELLKVGPKGYIHGWIHVGVPGVGDHVFHPRHGDGKVTHLDEHGHVHVTFAGGKSRSFAHTTGASGGLGRRSDHFKTGDKFSEHLRAAGAANRRGDHTAAADHYRQAADAATHPKIKAEMLARAERDAGKTPGNPTVEKPPVPVAPKSKYDEHMAAARDAAKRGDIPTAVRHYQEAGVHAPSKIHRNVAVRERVALDNTGTPKALTADEHDAEAARHNAAAADLEAKAKNLPAGVGNANGAGQRGRAQAAMAADARAHRQEADRHTAAALALRPKPAVTASHDPTLGSFKPQPWVHADSRLDLPDVDRNSPRSITGYPLSVGDEVSVGKKGERTYRGQDTRAKWTVTGVNQKTGNVSVVSQGSHAADGWVRGSRFGGGLQRRKPIQKEWPASEVHHEATVTDHEYRRVQNLGTGPNDEKIRSEYEGHPKAVRDALAARANEFSKEMYPDYANVAWTHALDEKNRRDMIQHALMTVPGADKMHVTYGRDEEGAHYYEVKDPTGSSGNRFRINPVVEHDAGGVYNQDKREWETFSANEVGGMNNRYAHRVSFAEAMNAGMNHDHTKVRANIDSRSARRRRADRGQKAPTMEPFTAAKRPLAAPAVEVPKPPTDQVVPGGDLNHKRIEGDAERAVMAGDHANAAAKYRELAQSIRDDKGGYTVHRDTSATNGRQWAVQHPDLNRRVGDGIFTRFKTRESAENAAGVKAESRAKEAERLATINDHAAVSGNGEAARLRVSGNRRLGMVDMYTAERNGRDSHPIAGAMTDEELKNATDASDLVLMNRNPTIDRALSDKIRGHLDAESTRRGLPQHSVTQRLSEESAKRRAEHGATPEAAGHPLAAAINHDHQAEEHRLNAQTLRARGQKLNAKTDPGGVKRADLNAKAEHHWAQARTESDAAQTIRQNATDPDHRMTLGQLDQHADQAIKEGRNHDAARMFAATADRMRAGEKFTSLSRGYTSGWKVSDPDRTSAMEFGARKDAEAYRERREAEILAVRDRIAKDYAARGHAAKPYNTRQQDAVEMARRRSGNPHLLIGAHEKLSKEDFHGLTPEHQQKITEHVEGLGQRSPGEVHNRAQALLDRWNGKPAGVEKPKDADEQERGVRRQAHLDAAQTALGNGDRAGASKEYDAAHLLSDSFGDRDAVRDDQIARMGLAMHPAAATQYLNHVTAHEMDGHPDKAAVEQLSRDISAGKTTPDEARKTIRGMTDRHLPGSKEAITLGHVHDGLITGESRDSRSTFQIRNDAMINRRRAQAGLDRLPEHEYTGAPGVVPGATVAKPTGRDTPVSKVDEHLAAADAKLRAGDRVGALNHLNIAAGHEKDAKARQAIIERQKTLGAELMGKKPPAVPPVEPKPVASSRAAEIAGKLRNVESRYQAHRIISSSGPGGSTPTMDHLGNVGRESGTGHVLASGIKKDKAIDRMADEAFRQAEESRAGTPMPHVVDASLNAGERSLASGDLTLAQHHVGEATARARNEADRKRIKNLGGRVETAQTQARADRDAAHRASLAEFDAKGQAAADAARAKFKPETITNPDLRAATEQHIENVRQDTTLQARMARGHSVAREADRAQTNVLRSQTDMSRIEGSRQLLSGTPSEGLIRGRAAAIENADRDATAEAHRVATAAGVDPATVETHRAALATHMGAANVAAVERNVADQRAKDLRFAGSNAYDPQVRRAFLAEADKSEADKVAAEQRRAAADVKAARARAELRFAAAPPKHVPAVVKPKKPRATPARPAAGRPYVEPSGLKPGAKVTWTHHYEDGSNGERTGRVWDAAPTSRGHDAAWVIPDERKPTDPYSALVVEQNKKTGKTTSHDVGTSHTGGLAQSAAAVAARHRAQRKSFPYQVAAMDAVIREVNAAYRRLVTA